MVIIGLLALALRGGAQEQLSRRQQADKLFDRYEYSKSLDLYLKVSAKNSLAINERIADCYREMNDYKSAEEWYAKTVAQPKAAKTDHYYYAETLLRNHKFNEAKEQYKLYYTDNLAGLSLKLADCDSAAAWMQHPANYTVKNTDHLNSQYSDWGLAFDGKLGFIFVSDRITNDVKTDGRTGNSWFKLYHASINWDEVSELPVVNQSNIKFDGAYHMGPIAVNAAADSAYITVTTEVAAKNIPSDQKENRSAQRLYTRRLQLLMAKKMNGRWVIYDDFPYNDIRYSVGDAALSKDGQVLYFSSDMPGGQGKTDLWYCEKLSDGTWGKPVNCGKNINTNDEDAFPYMDNDGTLYYASKGLPGMGGYDIYAAKGEKNNWSGPQNLKYPINTTADDLYLVTRDGATGYLSSNRDEGKGSDDIYSFVQDTTHHYKLKIVPNISPAQHPLVRKDKVELNNIYFDLDKYNIRPDAAAELDKTVVLLKQHTALRVEISGYTDSRASLAYNVILSQRRAVAAKDYLVKKGISADRLTVKWYGKNHPANQCANCTEDDYQLNRRVEFTILRE